MGSRLDHEGAWHHVMNRGARREPIFETAHDARTFLAIIGEQIERTGIEVHAYCLMRNHYHLLVRSVTGRLSDCMQQISASYARVFNQRRGIDGPLFRGRFRSKPITTDAYLHAVSRYIHRNPIDVQPAVALDRYRWSSYGVYVGVRTGPTWLRTGSLWELHGGSTPSFREHVEGPPVQVDADELADLLALCLAERHPDPSVDTRRVERTLAAALAERLPPARAAELVDALGYPTQAAARAGRWRARRLVETIPGADIILSRVAEIAA